MGENEIRNLADSHAGIDEWKKAGFNELQVLEITKGIDNGVDMLFGDNELCDGVTYLK